MTIEEKANLIEAYINEMERKSKMYLKIFRGFNNELKVNKEVSIETNLRRGLEYLEYCQRDYNEWLERLNELGINILIHPKNLNYIAQLN